MNTPTPRTCPRCKNDFSRCDEMFDCANRRDIPTPITDGASFGAYIADGSGHVVKSVVEVKVAKKLERDLAAAREELERVRDKCNEHYMALAAAQPTRKEGKMDT